MEVEPGEGWADVVSKILRMGTNNPESNRILSKAKKEHHSDDEDNSASGSDNEESQKKSNTLYATSRLRPQPQSDALVENELKSIATRGVVHLFNAVKTVNPKSDKKKKKKKKKKRQKKVKRRSFRK